MKHVVAYWTDTGEPILDTDMDYFEDAYEAERWLTYMWMDGYIVYDYRGTVSARQGYNELGEFYISDEGEFYA